MNRLCLEDGGALAFALDPKEGAGSVSRGKGAEGSGAGQAGNGRCGHTGRGFCPPRCSQPSRELIHGHR